MPAAENHTNHNDARPILFQLKFLLPFSLFLFVWRLESTTAKSLLRHLNSGIAEDLHCLKAVDRTLFEMKGQHRPIRCFAVGPVYPNKSPTMCSSDFVFRKCKQHSAFRISGVLQLAKTGPLLIPLRCYDGLKAYTPYDVNHTNLHILTAREMSHILTWIGQLWSSRKKSYALVWSPNSKIMNQCNIDFNFLEYRLKFHFIGTLRKLFIYGWFCE